MTTTQIVLLVVVFVTGVVLTALVMWARERWSRTAQAQVSEFRDTYEPLFADLWSDEMHRRLAALFVAQRIAKSKSGARGLGNVLISFVRKRLSEERDSYDDVRLALTVLSSGPVRQAQGESGQSLDLGGIDFRGANLSGVNLSGFRLAQCVLDRCRLAGARLSNCDLSGASLTGADLARADLRRADFSEADLSDADFTRAKVGLANFTSANIGGAILSEADGLSQEQLDQAFGDSGTAVPERMRFTPGRSQRRS
jgi:ABC-type cobalt transport system substrate-binding protein